DPRNTRRRCSKCKGRSDGSSAALFAELAAPPRPEPDQAEDQANWAADLEAPYRAADPGVTQHRAELGRYFEECLAVEFGAQCREADGENSAERPTDVRTDDNPKKESHAESIRAAGTRDDRGDEREDNRIENAEHRTFENALSDARAPQIFEPMPAQDIFE